MEIEISSLEDLKKINCGKSFYGRLTDDIDASETKHWNNGKGWDPIENFEGTLDGQGYTIKNLHINREVKNKQIGFVRKNRGTLMRLGFENANVVGGKCTGIVGIDLGGKLLGVEIKDSNIQGLKNAPSTEFCGGLVGISKGSRIWDCRVIDCDISTSYYSGGITGKSEEPNITGCEVKNSRIKGQKAVGGLIGYYSRRYEDVCFYNFDKTLVKNIKAEGNQNKGLIGAESGEELVIGKSPLPEDCTLKWYSDMRKLVQKR